MPPKGRTERAGGLRADLPTLWSVKVADWYKGLFAGFFLCFAIFVV
jgi:hypothetical protein